MNTLYAKHIILQLTLCNHDNNDNNDYYCIVKLNQFKAIICILL